MIVRKRVSEHEWLCCIFYSFTSIFSFSFFLS